MENVVRAWVDGWIVSRGAAPPVVETWGYTIDVGLPGHVGRHVFAGTDDAVREADVREVTGAVTGVGTQLKVFAEPARVVPWLGPGWEPFGSGDYLMTARLVPGGAVAVPDGYRLRTWTAGGVFRCLVTDSGGSFAARGQIAVTGATAVVDQIETDAAHRRRGLGAVVMRTLAAEGAALGAETGVLACTPEGRLLYEAVGWSVRAP
ncbi:GNAT family N-acetyltransferase, partial [Streptomyces triticagri]